MIKTKDVMTSQVITVKTDTPIIDAVELMVEHSISGMPVVDATNTLVGVITEKDVLKLHRATDRASGQKVEDFMTTPAVFFETDESMDDVCDCLIENEFKRVPVAENGKVVGVISRLDAIKHILKQLRG